MADSKESSGVRRYQQTFLSEKERADPAAVAASRAVIYVQRTPRNGHFFLLHRELIPTHPGNPSQCLVMPWLIFQPGGDLMMPPLCDESVTLPHMMRLCRSTLTGRFECVVCLEEKDLYASVTQLPCVHMLCVPCIRKLWPLETPGLECPVCRRFWPRHMVIPPQGTGPDVIALAEDMRVVA